MDLITEEPVMLLGLVTDIHEEARTLSNTLRHFEAEGVEQVVLIGDVFEVGEQIAETVALLKEAKAIGVWGNHDFGLCVDPDEQYIEKFGRETIDYLQTLKPSLEIEDCFFSHVYRWLNLSNPADLWYYDGPPDPARPKNVAHAARCFDNPASRVMFMGHFHRWRVLKERKPIEWEGDRPIQLAKPDRYLVVVHAVAQGHSATYDTETGWLRPHFC